MNIGKICPWGTEGAWVWGRSSWVIKSKRKEQFLRGFWHGPGSGWSSSHFWFLQIEWILTTKKAVWLLWDDYLVAMRLLLSTYGGQRQFCRGCTRTQDNLKIWSNYCWHWNIYDVKVGSECLWKSFSGVSSELKRDEMV